MDTPNALVVCLNPTLQKTLVFNSLAPGGVNRARHVRLDASGKGVNVARVLVQLGLQARHLTQAGGRFAALFAELCAADGVDLATVPTSAEIRFCTTAISAADGSATELVEPGEAVGPETVSAVRGVFERELAGCDLLIISGSRAPGFPEDLYPSMVAAARAAGATVILDYRGADLEASLPHRPDVVKINREEMIQTFGDDRDGVFADVSRRYGVHLVVTDGAGPVRYWTGAAVAAAQPPALESVNPIGSGDSFTAGMASVLLAAGGAVEGPAAALPVEAMVAEGIRCGAENARRLKPGCVVGETGFPG
jgi:1-phosphofructokinase family hexose kinase